MHMAPPRLSNKPENSQKELRKVLVAGDLNFSNVVLACKLLIASNCINRQKRSFGWLLAQS